MFFFGRYIALTNQTTYEIARRKRIFYLRYVTIGGTQFVTSIFLYCQDTRNIVVVYCLQGSP
jgi:hypothetical protein